VTSRASELFGAATASTGGETTASRAAATFASAASPVIVRLGSIWQAGATSVAQTFGVAGAAGDAGSTATPLATAIPGFATGSEAIASYVGTGPKREFEFAHLGSPFALLADSMAGFIEESASVPMTLAQSPASTHRPWGLTFSVIAADVVLLTYAYRNRKLRTRRLLVPSPSGRR
jgi:hypothetical protein